MECECPIPALGDSFKLSFEEIREVRIEKAGFDSDRFVVVDISDQEHNISLHFGTPVFRILDAIHDVNPTTTIVEYGRTWETDSARIAT